MSALPRVRGPLRAPHDSDRPPGDGESTHDSDDSIDRFVETLAVSLRPRDIDPDLHERILQQALGLEGEDGETAEGAERPANDDEARRAEILRVLLTRGQGGAAAGALEPEEERRLAGLARALRLAYAPPSIDELTNERLLKPGLRLVGGRTVRRMMAVTTFVLVAAAAGIIGLFVSRTAPNTTAMRLPVHTESMIEARSAASLFDPLEPFPKRGGETSRIDKIESSRGAELRDNLFASWGIE